MDYDIKLVKASYAQIIARPAIIEQGLAKREEFSAYSLGFAFIECYFTPEAPVEAPRLPPRYLNPIKTS